MIHTAMEVGIPVGDIARQGSSQAILKALPVRKNPQVEGIVTKNGKIPHLPQGWVYVGNGHHSHRLATTDWVCPYIAGQDGSHEECMLWFIQHVRSNCLLSRLPELYGKVLLCDCPLEVSCSADVLIAECFRRLSVRRGK